MHRSLPAFGRKAFPLRYAVFVFEGRLCTNGGHASQIVKNRGSRTYLAAAKCTFFVAKLFRRNDLWLYIGEQEIN